MTFHLGPWRRHRGVTLKALAKNTRLSVSALHRIETSEVSPSLDTMAVIAQALGATVEAMLGLPPGWMPGQKKRRRKPR